jgi:hypothetical protein
MKRKIISIILLLVMILTNFNINIRAEEGKLLLASLITSNGEKWGYIDETGTFIIKPQYNFAKDFNDKGIAIVANGSNSYDPCNVYFINKLGTIVSGPFFTPIPEFKNGFATLKTDKKGTLIVDETGKIILESKFNLYEYSDGLVSFSDTNNKLYGFMNLTGKVIIPAKYQSVQGFSNGKAIAEVSTGKYSVIDKTGKVLEVLKYYNEYNTSEGLTIFKDTNSSLYGYKLKDGTIAIEPQFRDATQFRDGYAVVGIDYEAYTTSYGLIDKDGEYVIKPEYSGINYVRDGLYVVSQNFYSPSYHYYLPKALINNKGEILTDYKFYSVAEFNGDYASACDSTTSFFIDKEGNIVDKLPRLQGIGEMKFIGNIIKAELDGGLCYLKENGEIIWQKDETIPLDNNIKVEKVKYRRDYLTYIEYPKVSGIKDQVVQDDINSRLKKDFIGVYESTKKVNDDECYEDIIKSFSVSKNKNLLIIEGSGYYYPIGAAHGMPSLEYHYIDTKTGAFYELKDLFKANSKYVEKLTEIVTSQIKLNARIGAISGAFSYTENSITISENQYFILGSDSIELYYYPYDIAAYVAGFPKFEIPYGQISNIINTKGAFWNSFDKKIVSHKINVLSDIKDSTVKAIESLMSSYEKNMVEAINSNNYSKVEACLLKGSNLYNSQKKLIQSLNKQKINEKLTKYEIYAVDYDFTNDEYKVYVFEEIGIKYTNKTYVNKKFDWCYTVKADKSGNYKLSNIQIW